MASPTPNAAEYQQAIDNALLLYTQNFNTLVQDNDYLNNTEIESNHAQFKDLAIDKYKQDLISEGLTEDPQFLKKLEDELNTKLLSYKNDNEKILRAKCNLIIYQARGIYEDGIKGKVETCNDIKLLIADHRSLKTASLKHFSDNKIQDIDMINAEFEQKLDKDLENLFAMYKTIIEFKDHKRLLEQEKRCSLIQSESVDIYKHGFDEILKSKPSLSEEDLQVEHKKASLDALNNYKRKTRNGNFDKTVVDKLNIALEKDIERCFHDYKDQNRIAINMVLARSEIECLYALADSQKFYIKLMENVSKNKTQVLNKDRFIKEHEKFKILIKSNYKKKSSTASEKIQKNYEQQLDEYLLYMAKLCGNLMNKE